jgi:hypothetical protein
MLVIVSVAENASAIGATARPSGNATVNHQGKAIGLRTENRPPETISLTAAPRLQAETGESTQAVEGQQTYVPPPMIPASREFRTLSYQPSGAFPQLIAPPRRPIAFRANSILAWLVQQIID